MHGSLFQDTMREIALASKQLNPDIKTPARGMLFNRTGWTFHSKGIWLHRLSGDSEVYASYIGSSNLGIRSWTRDFELGFILRTSTIPRKGGREGDKRVISEVFEDDWRRLAAHAETKCSKLFLIAANEGSTWKKKIVRYLSFAMRSYL
jgi:phosphatidylserine/phosphatidylglycerophosphate/cardiolipin synthase-like enzyme